MAFALPGAWSRRRPLALGQAFRFYESAVLRPLLLAVVVRFGPVIGIAPAVVGSAIVLFTAQIAAILLPERAAARAYAVIPAMNAVLWSAALVLSGSEPAPVAYLFFAEVAFAALRLSMVSCALVAGMGAAAFGVLAAIEDTSSARLLSAAAVGGFVTTGAAFLAVDRGRRRLHTFQRAHEDLTMTVHGLKNSLTGTAGFAELLALDLDPADPRRELAQRVQRGLADAHTRARALLTAGTRPAAAAGTPSTDLRAAVDHVLEALRPFLQRRAVQVEVQVAAGVAARIAPEVLDVVLTELVQNAAEAMSPGGGVLTVSGSGDPPRLRLRDTGPGVAAELASQIFVPGFTTRPHGNGLGLASARALLAPYRATLAVATGETRGGCFEIHFAPAPPAAGRDAMGLGWRARRRDGGD